MVSALGVGATTLLAAITLLGDGTGITYAAGVVAFWWLLPTVLLLVAATIRRRWSVAATLLAPALVWLWVFGPLFLPGLPSAHADDGVQSVRLVTFNMAPRNTASHVVELARRTRPDVLLLQELRPQAHPSLEAGLDGYDHRWFAPVNAQAPGGGGVAVLSRFRIVRVESIEGLPPSARPTGVVTLDVGGHELAVVPLHLASPQLDEMAGQLSEAGAPTRTRRRETARILKALPDGPVVVAGDLNSSVLNEPVGAFVDAGLTDAYQAVGWGPGFTRGARKDVSRIDFVLTGGGVVPRSSHVDHANRSDHRPVVAELLVP